MTVDICWLQWISMGCWGCMLATVDNCEFFVAIFRLLWIYVGYNDYMWLTVDISFIC